jgi:hypothetical protein
VPGRRAYARHEDHEAKEQIKQKNLRGSTVSEPALEQQKQNHLRPWSRRLTAEEEKNKRVRKPESHRNNKSWYTHLLRDF